MNALLVVFMVFWFFWLVVERKAFSAREAARFRSDPQDLFNQIARQYNLILTAFGARQSKKNKIGYQAAHSEKDMSAQLQAAGLESPIEQGRFFLLRVACGTLGPMIGVATYAILPQYYATLCTLFCSAFGLVLPILWLKMRIANRNEDIQRELPLVLDLTNLGTSAGWDVAAALERVIDSLYREFNDHPLFKELKRARWLTASGYTWNEALERVSRRLANDSVRRTTLALGQAMKQGGDRTAQLEGIAEDAQRAYYSELDKRLAALPVKVLIITVVLMVGYFMLILSPAAVQVKNIMMPG